MAPYKASVPKGNSWRENTFFIFIWLVLICSTYTASQSTNVKLRGAGASFPAPVYKNWLQTYKAIQHQLVALEMTYDSVGNGEGKARIKAKKDNRNVEYAGSDCPLKDEDFKTHPDLQMFPTMAGAVGLGYNIQGVFNLNLSQEHLVGIYNGSSCWWNDSSIQDLNPGVIMPREKIVVIARADKSDTTEIFTSALSSFSSHWNSKFGIFSKGLNSSGLPEVWNPDAIAYYSQTNYGVSKLIMSTAYSIGYMSAADAKEADIRTAYLQNRAGNLVNTDAENVQGAMDDHANSFSPRFTASLSDGGGMFSYPIARYTYFVIYLHTMPNCDSAMELYQFVEWFLFDTESQSICKDLNMVPLSKNVANKVWSEVFSLMTCNGRPVHKMSTEQKQPNKTSVQTWITPVIISAIFLVIVIFLLVSFLVHQQFKLKRSLIKEEWRIPIEDLNMTDSGRIKSSRLSNLKSLGSATALSKGSPRASDQMTYEQVFVGKWCEQVICLSKLEINDIKELKTNTKRQLLWMRDSVNHINVLHFYGVTIQQENVHMVQEFGSKGILRDVLQNDKFKFDNNFKFSLASDIANGIRYLHSLGVIHGCLSSDNCLIDARWNVKIAGWELKVIADSQNISSNKPMPVEDGESGFYEENIVTRKQFYTAPELLHEPNMNLTKMMDVYSYSILLIEIFTREDPYSEHTDILALEGVIHKIQYEDLRPTLTKDIPETAQPLVMKAWSSNPFKRPTFSEIIKSLSKANPIKQCVMDCMMEAIEEYVSHLEEKIEERTEELAVAMDSMEGLLHKIMPPPVAERLYKGEPVLPETFASVTVFFSDIVGFTTLSAVSTPMQIITMLNDLYTCFDCVLDQHDVYKMETIGDAYMVISGLPIWNGDCHAAQIASMAIELMVEVNKFKIHHRPNIKLRMRAGIHSGPVVAGVVGTKMPRYTLFGDTVNTASRMESTSLPNHVQITNATLQLLPKEESFRIMYRGDVQVKGKGTMKTFWLQGKGDLMCPSAPELVSHGSGSPGGYGISIVNITKDLRASDTSANLAAMSCDPYPQKFAEHDNVLDIGDCDSGDGRAMVLGQSSDGSVIFLR